MTSDNRPADDPQYLHAGDAWSKTYTVTGVAVGAAGDWVAAVFTAESDTVALLTTAVAVTATTVTFSLTGTQTAALVAAGATKFAGWWTVRNTPNAATYIAGRFVADLKGVTQSAAGTTTLTVTNGTTATLTVGTSVPAASINPDVSNTRSLTTADSTAALAIARLEKFHSVSNPYQWSDVPGLAMRAAWHKRNAEPFSVVVVGDSIGVGYYASVRERWIDALSDRLAAAAGQPGGQWGYISAHSQCVYSTSAMTTTGTGDDRADVGLGLGGCNIDSGGSKSFTFQGDACDVYYPTYASLAWPLNITVDGSLVTTISLTAPGSSGNRYRWTGASGIHTITLAPQTAGTVVEGIHPFNGNSTSGVQVWSGSKFGASATNFETTTTWTGGFGTIIPKVVMIALQTNDQGTVTAAQYAASITNIIATIRAAAPVAARPPTIILCVPFGKGATSTESNDYQRATWKVGLDKNCMVLDWSKLGGYVGTGGDAYGISYDNLHPNDYGHRLMGEFAASFILDAVGASRPRPVNSPWIKTANYTLTAKDSTVFADATTAPFTVTLPSAVSVAGTSCTVKRTSTNANAVTIGTTSAQTIDGAGTYVLAAGESLTVVSDGANWRIPASFKPAAKVFSDVTGLANTGAGFNAGLRVNTPNTVDNLADLTVTASATTSKPLVVQAAAMHAANLQEWQGSAGAILGRVNKDGYVGIGTGTAPARGKLDVAQVTGADVPHINFHKPTASASKGWNIAIGEDGNWTGRLKFFGEGQNENQWSLALLSSEDGWGASSTYLFSAPRFCSDINGRGNSAISKWTNDAANNFSGTYDAGQSYTGGPPPATFSRFNAWIGSTATSDFNVVRHTDNANLLTIQGSTGNITPIDGANIVLSATTGLKIGTAVGQKLAFWNKAPIAQPTTAFAAAAFAAGAGTAVNDASTFDGYTLGQVVAALRGIGALA